MSQVTHNITGHVEVPLSVRVLPCEEREVHYRQENEDSHADVGACALALVSSEVAGSVGISTSGKARCSVKGARSEF
jgi:hypothetical protein